MTQKKLGKDSSLRNATLIFIIYFLFIIFLIILGQNKLIKSAKKELYLESTVISSNIKLVLSVSKDYMNILSNGKTINAYFSNKALGMSLEYGLKANIIKIKKEIDEFINSKKIKQIKIFDDICLYNEHNKNIIGNSKKSILCNDLIESLNKTYSKEHYLIKEKDGSLELFLVKSIIVDNKKIGTLVGKINLKEILNSYIFNPNIKRVTFLMINGNFYDVENLQKNKHIHMFKDYIAHELDSNGIELIFNYQSKTNFFTSNIFLFLLCLSSIIIYFIAFKLIRLNTKNELLKEKIQYTEKANFILEDKVKEKTKELKKFNKELKEKVEEEVNNNKNKESIIYNQSKMAIMGQMLDNIAHQWRQPLSAISSNASSVKIQKELNLLDDKTLLSIMDNVISSTKFLSETIEDFRGFLRENKKNESFNVKEVYNKTRKLLISVTKNSDVEVIERLDDVLMYGFSNELVQVLLNIINNAYDALGEKNINQKKYIFIDISSNDKNVIIKIKDNAGGVPPEIIEKIFDAHFSTKLETTGTGIGLYMTKEIVEKHMKGYISVSNKSYEFKGKTYIGAEFYIKLPKK